MPLLHLPYNDQIPVSGLAACFNNTSATYKFYWLLAILKRVENRESSIPKINLFAEMIAHCWYTVNYFHVSFGKQDKLQEAVQKIRTLEPTLTIDTQHEQVYRLLVNSGNPKIRSILRYFNGEVPHRFLSPWFHANDKIIAYRASRVYTENCPYGVYEDHIEINPLWISYLRQNAGILRDSTIGTLLFTYSRRILTFPTHLISW